jgi:phospholipase/carboxylesterase
VTLEFNERPAAGEPEGNLVLFHGRGADEYDLVPLLYALDPERRLRGLTPRGPLALPPGGRHWYVVRVVGSPDPATFWPTYRQTAEWLDTLDLDRTVIGGFSQGAVMSYALGLGRGRPRPAGIAALSGFVPSVEGFELDLDSPIPPVAIGHGTYDQVIPVEFGRQARAVLEEAGADVLYREYPLPHAVDPRFVQELAPWIRSRLAREVSRPS